MYDVSLFSVALFLSIFSSLTDPFYLSCVALEFASKAKILSLSLSRRCFGAY